MGIPAAREPFLTTQVFLKKFFRRCIKLNKTELKTVENLKALGIYKPEYDNAIAVYAGLIDQYTALEREFKKSKFTVIEKTGYSDNAKKSPMVATLENLRKDILAYSNALGLTPAGFRKIAEDQKKSKPQASKLEQALATFGT
jgi:phage terminase small subunit